MDLCASICGAGSSIPYIDVSKSSRVDCASRPIGVLSLRPIPLGFCVKAKFAFANQGVFQNGESFGFGAGGRVYVRV